MPVGRVFFCSECGGPVGPLTPAESWDGPVPFVVGSAGEATWTRYASPCGHVSVVRADGGELDLEIVREMALNKPSNELTIFGKDDG